jgi:hypothetical protein
MTAIELAAPASLPAAQEALRLVNEQLETLATRRREALLRGTDDDVAAVDAEIAAAQHLQRTRSDRVEALTEESERAATEQRARDRETAIAQIEARFRRRDKLAARLASLVKSADAAFVQLCVANHGIMDAWPWQHGHVGAALLGDGDVALALSHELFRVGGRLPPGGGSPNPHPAPTWPGAKCSQLEFIMMPERTTSMVDKFAMASAAAGRILRSGRNDPLPVMNGATAPPVPAEPAQPTEAAPVASADEPAPLKIAVPFERSSREIEISSLLVRQNELASKIEMTEADEAEYAANGERIRALS